MGKADPPKFIYPERFIGLGGATRNARMYDPLNTSPDRRLDNLPPQPRVRRLALPVAIVVVVILFLAFFLRG